MRANTVAAMIAGESTLFNNLSARHTAARDLLYPFFFNGFTAGWRVVNRDRFGRICGGLHRKPVGSSQRPIPKLSGARPLP